MGATPQDYGVAEHPAPVAAVRKQLERVGASRAFSGSDRPRKFLTFLVERSLAGRAETLTEYLLAKEVFNRPGTFRADVDPIVRVEAGRLRKKLRAYYDEEGLHDTTVIDLPSRTYVPLIWTRPAIPPTVARAQSRRSVLPRRKLLMIAGAVIAAGAAVISLVVWGGGTDVRAAGNQASAVESSVVVVPFRDLSPGESQTAFCDGLTDEVIGELAKHGNGLRVVSSTSAFAVNKNEDVPAIARRFHAGLVVEGSVRRKGSRILVNVAMVDGAGGMTIWARDYEREVKDELDSQQELAHTIAAAVAAARGPR
jgi:TolB-like protein